MVESIGSATIRAGIAPVTNVQRAGAAAPVASVATAAKPTGTDATQASGAMASAMAAAPPVDADRVQEIKTALANGTFPLSPSTIADQFIALRYDWMSQNEQA
jgi:negative regulator of flagellin synthesis FlgM